MVESEMSAVPAIAARAGSQGLPGVQHAGVENFAEPVTECAQADLFYAADDGPARQKVEKLIRHRFAQSVWRAGPAFGHRPSHPSLVRPGTRTAVGPASGLQDVNPLSRFHVRRGAAKRFRFRESDPTRCALTLNFQHFGTAWRTG
jgi:hypothetical protein